MNTDLKPLAILVFLLLQAILLPGYGGQGKQTSTPSGKFLSDTIEVGKVFSYALSYRHTSAHEVFFPDSTYDFSPFRFAGQQFFTTYTQGSQSLDSTVYKLIAYEVTPDLKLSLPVYILNGKDCTAVYAEEDTVFVRLSVPREHPKNLKILEDNTVIPSGLDFNYSIVLLSLIAAGLLAFSIYWFFGEVVSRQWQLFQLQRRHGDFLRSFNKLNPGQLQQPNLSNAENAVILWKKYLQKILKKPFATYTTKEILDHFKNEELAQALKEIDRAIYGQMKSDRIPDAMQALRDVAQSVYRNQRRVIADSHEEHTHHNPELKQA